MSESVGTTKQINGETHILTLFGWVRYVELSVSLKQATVEQILEELKNRGLKVSVSK